ncbi:hypothetical protein [Streptomyces rimosus]|uniref:hypothetical protein n=1 Tax=Streptomyces rimosus TaxID=1927 RepID=UPI00159BD62C
MISTAAVQRIPPAWLDQMSAGGTILTPLATPFGSTPWPAALRRPRRRRGPPAVAAVNFMPVRGQRGHRQWRDLGWFRFPDCASSLTTTARHPNSEVTPARPLHDGAVPTYRLSASSDRYH